MAGKVAFYVFMKSCTVCRAVLCCPRALLHLLYCRGGAWKQQGGNCMGWSILQMCWARCEFPSASSEGKLASCCFPAPRRIRSLCTCSELVTLRPQLMSLHTARVWQKYWDHERKKLKQLGESKGVWVKNDERQLVHWEDLLPLWLAEALSLPQTSAPAGVHRGHVVCCIFQRQSWEIWGRSYAGLSGCDQPFFLFKTTKFKVKTFIDAARSLMPNSPSGSPDHPLRVSEVWASCSLRADLAQEEHTVSPGELEGRESLTPQNCGGCEIEYLCLDWIILDVGNFRLRNMSDKLC